MPPVSRADDTSVAAICGIFAAALDVDAVAADDDFFDLGGSSLKAAIVIALIRRRWGSRPTLADLYAAPTAAGLCARLDAGRRAGESGDVAPVFIIHWSVSDLAREIARRRPVIVLSYGLTTARGEDRWPPPVGIEALATHYVAEMRRVRPAGPYHLVGYSLGAVIAWEMARQLIAAGARVGLLGLIDSVPPQVRRRPLPRRAVAVNIARTSPIALAKRLRGRLVRSVGHRAWVRRMRWQRSDEHSRIELIDHRLADYRMLPLPGYGGPLVLIEGTGTARPHAVQYQPPPALHQAYEELGLLPQEYRIVGLPGDHFSVITAPFVVEVAAAIEAAIGE